MLRRSFAGLVAVVASGTVPAAAVSGGTPVPDPAEAPWMVTLAANGPAPLTQRARRGGVLVAPDRVATAGHCLDRADPNHIEVHLGASTLSTHPGKIVPIKGFAVRPDYRLISSPTDPGDLLLRRGRQRRGDRPVRRAAVGQAVPAGRAPGGPRWANRSRSTATA